MFRTITAILFAFVLLLSLEIQAATLRLVTSLDPLEATEYLQAFEKDTGIRVQWVRLSAGEALARLKSEARNPTQDVWFGAPCTEFIAAKKAGLLTPYISPNLGMIDRRWVIDKEGYWTGVYFGTIVFISRKGTPRPSSWQELLDPGYKGEIVISYPYTAGTGYAAFAGLVSIMGEAGALDYYQRLDRQIRRYTKSGSAPIVEVGLGEANVGVVFDQDALRKGIARGFPLMMSYPSDGVPFEIGGVAAIKGGQEDLAKRFIDWILSLPAQDLMHKWYRIPINPKAIVNDRSTPLNKLPLAKMDFIKAGEERERLIDQWRERIGK